MRTSLAVVMLAAGLAATPAALAQQTAYAIGNGGDTLLRFQTNDPSNVTVVGTFNGAASSLNAIDFRPLNGQLYGYLDSSDSFYTVDLNTATLTLASVQPSAAPTNSPRLGLDFNPQIDRARLVTDSDQNIVYNPNTGQVAAFTTLFYAMGDVNASADPNIVANAYTQNFAGTPTTQQYAIDHELDVLVTLANNAGTLVTVGPLGVNTGLFTGFDIFTEAGGVDLAYAVMTTPGGAPTFYSINLATGAATPVGVMGFTNQVNSLAIIPAPAGVGLLLAGALVALRRRRGR